MEFRFGGMSTQEMHAWEDEAAATLKRLCPDHPALRYYGSTQAAIKAYENAIREIWAAASAQPAASTGAPRAL